MLQDATGSSWQIVLRVVIARWGGLSLIIKTEMQMHGLISPEKRRILQVQSADKYGIHKNLMK
jgi:hypothetical protein